MPHSEFQNLISSLKTVMKAKKFTYSKLAKELKVSEATVKRFFTSTDGSVERISKICGALAISFADLVEHSKNRKELVFNLSIEQETFFASNLNYYYFFREILNGELDLKGIKLKYKLTQHSINKYLKQLERMNLLEWLPNDCVKLKVSGTHSWVDGGPLQLKFLRTDSVAFLEYMLKSFQRDLHMLTTSDRHVHPETLKVLISELRGLAISFRKRAYKDETFFSKSDLIPVKWLMGIGPFQKEYTSKIENL